MHIYVFGSLCRGEVSRESDVDLLAIVSGRDDRFDPEKFSVYSYTRIEELWLTGNAFAWHLALEGRLVYADDGRDYLKSLGIPARYQACISDCKRFAALFDKAFKTVRAGTNSTIFELSTIFLSTRNMASCYALGVLGTANFSRSVARQLGAKSIRLSDRAFSALERARMLSIRGTGEFVQEGDVAAVLAELTNLEEWIQQRLREAEDRG